MKQRKSDPRNARKHNARNKQVIRESLEEIGGGRSVLAGRDHIIAGNTVYAEALRLGMDIREIPAQPNELIVVVRDDLYGDRATRAALLDNAASDTSAHQWDTEQLRQVLVMSPEMLRGLEEVQQQYEAAIAQAEQQIVSDRMQRNEGVDASQGYTPSDDAPEGEVKERRYTVIVICENKDHQETVLNDLEALGYECKAR